ncbi:PD-(D/E)XK nuclease family protein [Sphingomonas sp. S2-65]|uniref:PD-(D/E)XK nuclease family protein n=1 Tax=Sphingomonas sp. S2-65 TaxID=2903960 RepID=UPI001F261985|nr:PD-(D/E)XK nuclease family protein [Sphingomonas sp. S2-65]UYY58014.1 PD-(D/E)XK nuclease family protein [Sphingomonas sp. S2-65]
MMDVVFGLWADAGAWPEHGGEGPASFGAPVVGPNGMLDLIETACGLGSPSVPAVVRIAAFQSALEAMSSTSRFWSRSLGVDGWATARTLLGWRDELIEAGWRPGAGHDGVRLADLAAAHAAARDLPAGKADRIAAAWAALEDRPPLPMRRVRLIDARHLHPAGWRRLLDRVEACGVAIVELEPIAAAPDGSALGALQRWMIGSQDLAGAADGTVTIATSVSKALAAEVTSHWFAAKGEGEVVLVAPDADTQLLDQAFARAGLPRSGRSRASAHRGSLQVLLLAFKAAWAPFDPSALMELLVFPTSPIAPRAGRLLAAALEEAPGRGGPAWIDAWSELAAAERNAAEQDAAALAKAEARLSRWRAWAEPAIVDAEQGIPLEQALETCDRVIAWAGVRHAADGDALYLGTATLTGDVRRALVALRREHLPRTLVERVIDQALDVGQGNPAVEAEAATWRSVVHPGSIWAPVESVVWWGFGADEDAPRRQPWTDRERQELLEQGCTLDAPDRAGRAASAAWERAVLNARGRIVFVAGRLDSGKDDAMHPLAHRIAPAEHLIEATRIEDALSSRTLALAGIPLEREAVEFAALPERRTTWPTPLGYADRVRGLEHSATSFENGLACQLMWALKHVARLRSGRVRSIPDASQLLGNLAHALAHDIFLPGAPPAPEHAARRARVILAELVDSMAAPLRLPEFAAQLADAMDRLPSAMAELARTLAENRLVVEASELQVSASFVEALAVRGAVDLVARDPEGRHVIIDLKWTRNPKGRLTELEKGAAIQLATYGAMVAQGAPYRAGYFLLNQRQFATLSEDGLIGRLVNGGRAHAETWQAVRESWRLMTNAASAGRLVASGVDDAAEHLPADLPIVLEANCGWCEYQTLCRVRGLK